jgi:hypothetical protein
MFRSQGLATIPMMTCKEVSTLVSTGDVERAPMARRLAVWLHVAMCRHCRAFRRQIALIGRAARPVSEAFAREPSPSFEGKILEHLGS